MAFGHLATYYIVDSRNIALGCSRFIQYPGLQWLSQGCPCRRHSVISVVLQALLQEFTHVGRNIDMLADRLQQLELPEKTEGMLPDLLS